MDAEDTASALGIPARSAPNSVGPAGSRSISAVSAEQASQAAGPTSQPQSSNEWCGSAIPSTADSAATATSCTTAARQKVPLLTPRILSVITSPGRLAQLESACLTRFQLAAALGRALPLG